MNFSKIFSAVEKAAFLAVFCCLLAGTAQADITTGLVAHHPCQDNAATTTVVALVGTNGTLNGAGNTSSSTAAGPNAAWPAALLTDGTNDYIDCAGNYSLDGATTASIAAWIYRGAASTIQCYGTRASGTARYHIQWGGDNRIYNVIGGAAPFVLKNETGWHHVVITYDASAAPKQKTYYDGALQTLTGSQTSATTLPAAQGNVNAGRTESGFGAGRYADIRVYNRVLSAADVTELFELGNPPVITTSATQEIDEDETAVVTVTADGPTPITWSISGGANAASFTINESTGALAFLSAPTISGGQPFDDYEVEVTATNANGSDPQTFDVRVLDAPPDIFTDHTAWLAWKDARIAWFEVECPSARTTTYYYSPTGDDTTGDGSQGNPWRSRAKAISMTAADTRHRFERGGEYEGIDNWVITANNVTIDSYGTGAKPLFDGFAENYLASADLWTNASGNLWETSEASDIAWLRLTADRLGETRGTTLIRVADSTACGATANSWYWDDVSDTLYVNLNGDSPNDHDLEAVTSNTANGVEFQGTGCRAEDIRADGFGCHRTTTATQAQPFTARTQGDETNAVINCEGYFSGSHAMAHNMPTGSGGVTLFNGCTAGLTKYNGVAGETVFNSFASAGDSETWFVDCECRYGTLKSADWSYAAAKARASAFFAHTSGAPLQRLLMMYGCSVPASHSPPSALCMAGGTRDPAGDYTEVRAFRAYCQFGPLGEAVAQMPSLGIFRADSIIYADRQYINSTSANPQALESSTTNDCWYANSIIDLDMGSTTAAWALENTTANYAIHFWHTLIRERNSAQNFGVDYDVAHAGGSFAQNCSMVNSIVAFDSGNVRTATLALTNSAFDGTTGIANNAYWRVDQDAGQERGYDADPAAEALAKLSSLTAVPTVGVAAGNATIPHFSHDIDGEPRPAGTPDIGPFASGRQLLHVLLSAESQ